MKKYVVLLTSDMSVKWFEHKDELQVALAALRKAGAIFEVYKYNEGADMYIRQDVYDV